MFKVVPSGTTLLSCRPPIDLGRGFQQCRGEFPRLVAIGTFETGMLAVLYVDAGAFDEIVVDGPIGQLDGAGVHPDCVVGDGAVGAEDDPVRRVGLPIVDEFSAGWGV
jgi:hypothetical protein